MACRHRASSFCVTIYIHQNQIMVKNHLLLPISLLFLLAITVASCSPEGPAQQQKFQLKPRAYGELSQITIIADKILWNSDLQDTVSYYFGSAYPLLPQPEPRYDMLYFTPEELLETQLRREQRIYVLLVNLADEKSALTRMAKQDLPEGKIKEALQKGHKTVFSHDKWATGQLLVYILAKNPEELKKAIIADFPGIDKKLRAFDKDKIAAGVYFSGRERHLEKKIESKFGLHLKVPDTYVLAIEDKNFLWIRDDKREDVTKGIFLYKVPYESKEQLTPKGAKAIFEKAGRYITTSIPNTRMLINDRDLPLLSKQMQLNGIYTLELRGIWEMKNDFLGGPFVAYLLLNPKTNELILLNGFLFAPGEDKRRFMQEVEHVLRTVKLM